MHIVDQWCLRGVVRGHYDLDLESIEGWDVLNTEGECLPLVGLNRLRIDFVGGSWFDDFRVVRETSSVEWDPVDLGQFTVVSDRTRAVVDLDILNVVEDACQLDLNTIAGTLEQEQTGDPLGEDGTVVVALGSETCVGDAGYALNAHAREGCVGEDGSVCQVSNVLTTALDLVRGKVDLDDRGAVGINTSGEVNGVTNQEVRGSDVTCEGNHLGRSTEDWVGGLRIVNQVANDSSVGALHVQNRRDLIAQGLHLNGGSEGTLTLEVQRTVVLRFVQVVSNDARTTVVETLCEVDVVLEYRGDTSERHRRW